MSIKYQLKKVKDQAQIAFINPYKNHQIGYKMVKEFNKRYHAGNVSVFENQDKNEEMEYGCQMEKYDLKNAEEFSEQLKSKNVDTIFYFDFQLRSGVQ